MDLDKNILNCGIETEPTYTLLYMNEHPTVSLQKASLQVYVKPFMVLSFLYNRLLCTLWNHINKLEYLNVDVPIFSSQEDLQNKRVYIHVSSCLGLLTLTWWPSHLDAFTPHRQREAQAQLPPEIDDEDVTDLAIECKEYNHISLRYLANQWITALCRDFGSVMQPFKASLFRSCSWNACFATRNFGAFAFIHYYFNFTLSEIPAFLNEQRSSLSIWAFGGLGWRFPFRPLVLVHQKCSRTLTLISKVAGWSVDSMERTEL